MVTLDSISELTRSQHGVVGRRQLRGCGDASLRNLVKRGWLEELTPEVLVVKGAPQTPERDAMTAVLDAPGEAYLSHRSAAALWDVPGFVLARPFHVIIPWQGVKRDNTFGTVHYHRGLPQDHLLTYRGIPVTSPVLTVFLLAATESPGRTERALDSVLRMRLAKVEAFHSLLVRLAARGRNGIRLMRDLLEVRPPGHVPTDSNLELRVEEIAASQGVELRRQVHIDDGITWLGRADFEVVGSPGIVEVLSQRYHGSLSDRRRDHQRHQAFEAAGRPVLTVWDEDVWYRPDLVAEAIAAFAHQVGAPPYYPFWRGEPDL